MNIFDKNNFTNEKISFLNFDESFSIGDSNSVIFGFNGIGKTSLFKCLSNIHPNYVYLDYDNFPKFTSSGKKTNNIDKC